MKTPIKLSVNGGEKTVVNIPLIQPAKLSGTLFVYNYEKSENITKTSVSQTHTSVFHFADSPPLEETKKLKKDYLLKNSVVELENQYDMKRTVTDRLGQFAFYEIRPGKWNLKIKAQNLPQNHYIEKSAYSLDLQPGSTKTIDVRILPRQRKIKMLTTNPKTIIQQNQN